MCNPQQGFKMFTFYELKKALETGNKKNGYYKNE
jgi:hypothetical protein